MHLFKRVSPFRSNFLYNNYKITLKVIDVKNNFNSICAQLF